MTQPQQWEYDVVPLPGKHVGSSAYIPGDPHGPYVSREELIADVLNGHAAEGWRVVAIHPASAGQPAYAVMERPQQQG